MILLTGATGYVGGRLLSALSAAGHPVRCLCRRPGALRADTPPHVEVVAGDVLDAGSLPPAMKGVRTAYYLIHAMGNRGDFEEAERHAARNFGRAAAEAGVRRLVYLGGLGDASEGLSTHLRSRQQTGDILRESGLPVTELRASIIIGSGSLSFEVMRALTERLPVMVTPRWVSTLCQPIAVDDVLAYLVAALDVRAEGGAIFEIGGADQLSYGDLIREYARQRGLRRWMIPVPVLTPWLSSLWLALVTPLQFRVGRRLIEGLRTPTVVRDETARQTFGLQPMGVRNAIAAALRDSALPDP